MIHVVCRAVVLALVSILTAPLWAGFAQAAEIDEAIELFRSGHYAECAELAGKQIEQRAYSENWRLLKLQSEMAIGRFAEALATLDKALQDFPTSIRLRWLGHTVCLFNGQSERAEKLLSEIDEFVARAAWRYRDSDSRVTLGRYYLRRGVDPRKVLDATINSGQEGRSRVCGCLSGRGGAGPGQARLPIGGRRIGQGAQAERSPSGRVVRLGLRLRSQRARSSGSATCRPP